MDYKSKRQGDKYIFIFCKFMESDQENYIDYRVIGRRSTRTKIATQPMGKPWQLIRLDNLSREDLLEIYTHLLFEVQEIFEGNNPIIKNGYLLKLEELYLRFYEMKDIFSKEEEEEMKQEAKFEAFRQHLIEGDRARFLEKNNILLDAPSSPNQLRKWLKTDSGKKGA